MTDTKPTNYSDGRLNLGYKPELKPSKKAEVEQPNWHLVIKHYRWMTKMLKWQHDNTGLNIGMYSPELTEAIEELRQLEKWEQLQNEQETKYAILPC